ncbi:hypothetical protein LTR62_002539 [Meristemomyces frigidus]|uniref:WLM domain-containing protein n=1 Tax=Meristemomyces frigidus TaxID=1508187 RepID=A0AAN7YHE0_9PEZI|nr:hypothetical protein LTR62_002539 [Meristemomyces frigidus]
MPLGLLRLNEKTQRPNTNINFIKPDPRASPADQAISHDFLSRIAAQCYPVMKENWISVMTLEEHAPNPEFLGRNFNAGECIQLVLKDKRGRWLSFQFVQMVMMHELAHCKQMNHSRFFWNVRNKYAKIMEGLWAKGYKGEGLWGRGKELDSGSFVHDSMPQNAEIPEHLCGGTYRRARGKKRKRVGQGGEDGGKEKLTYAERQQKRIQRKFGKHGDGNAIGDDELVRGALDGMSGKRHAGKPKVAKSKRGRDLRANAALARFEAAKAATVREETPDLVKDEGSETESEYDWSSDEDGGVAGSLKQKGQIHVHDGKDMLKVCGDEAEEDGSGQQDELNELRILSGRPTTSLDNRASARVQLAGEKKAPWPNTVDLGSEAESEVECYSEQPDSDGKPSARKSKAEKTRTAQKRSTEAKDDSKTESKVDRRLRQHDSDQMVVSGTTPDQKTTPIRTKSPPPKADDTPDPTRPPSQSAHPPQQPQSTTPPPRPINSPSLTCPICSLSNAPQAPTCTACSHVLKPSLVKGSWRCGSQTCKESGSQYVNAGDVGRCGVCGGKKGPVGASEVMGVGVVPAEVLRWD